MFTATFAVLAVSCVQASAIDLKDCKAIKELPDRIACSEGNVRMLSDALAKTVQLGKDYKLSTRGRCLSYYDENKGAITMTCDHPDLQGWRME
ncbi:hypothetical protein [Bradyrhizobium sp. WSM471]|uniref:hypothetical protein n=1 Tax=Bradyrhizobium sp. WSM471 TaxID=319017 RepID=UPI0012F8A7CB|nr:MULTISPECIES: hypothetical protein [Bradyrhizobium]UFW38865.1 hypothetical protein BcanWSM471_21825 [Bradyrhizobium canariense]